MPKYVAYFALLFIPSVVIARPIATSPGTAPSGDALPLYEEAGQFIRQQHNQIESPSNSNLSYPAFPPFGEKWLKQEKPDFEADAQIRRWVHQAAGMDRADWPAFDPDPQKMTSSLAYLMECRFVFNEVHDAALYQSLFLNDQPAAFGSQQDIHHMVVLLQDQPGITVLRELVAISIAAGNVYTSDVIVSGAQLTDDPANHDNLPVATAREWIHQLLDHPDVQARFDVVLDGEFRFGQTQTPRLKTKKEFMESPAVRKELPMLMTQLRRIAADRDMAAMSLAAHLYRFHHHRWPASFGELETELPAAPIDPFGDGKQTLGYTLIPHGLPDGGDRPLVYSRENGNAGLSYRTDQPQYGYYRGEGSPQLRDRPLPSGQFRDVARWAPPVNALAGPTTRPLNP